MEFVYLQSGQVLQRYDNPEEAQVEVEKINSVSNFEHRVITTIVKGKIYCWHIGIFIGNYFIDYV